MQKEKVDLCIPKIFVSVLYYVGFESVEKDRNDNFHSRRYCYVSKYPKFKAIYVFEQEVLPKELQCRSNYIQNIDWQIHLDQFDIILGGLVGTDGIANHAVTIYNN